MAKVRINFAISQPMRDWILQQTEVIGIVENSDWHVIVEHNLAGQAALDLKNAFVNKLIEPI